jgi:hypothetical protein
MYGEHAVGTGPRIWAAKSSSDKVSALDATDSDRGEAAMSLLLRLLFIALMCGSSASALCAQQTTVIFVQSGFPAADTSAVSAAALAQGFSAARVVDAAQLDDALAAPQTNLLVLPYGSAYPEAAWLSILRYLDRGGNLIVLGGKPFTRAAYREGDTWRLRAPSIAASLELFIQGYQSTPGSQALHFDPNVEVAPQLQPFAWKQAYSPVIRLSVTPASRDELGAAGSEDAYLTTLAWGTQDGQKLAAPALLIDHVHNRFVGGRWIFLACTPDGDSLNDPQLLHTLQILALRQNDRFSFLPRVPLFLHGEALEFRFKPAESLAAHAGDVLKVAVLAEDSTPQHFTFAADAAQAVTLPQSAAAGSGLHTVEAVLWRKGAPVWTYRSGFWLRDLAWLRSGPTLSVNADYFELNGKTLPVVGTTYMASDVDREFLAEPNAYVWNRDMEQIHTEGLNMIRTGIWSGWDQLVNPNKSVRDDTLRAIEAFLMTARTYNLPVQFNLFAFLPDIFGGSNAYLDPAARQLQDSYVYSLVKRFHDVPFLAWDLINEPSANANLWKTLPMHEPFEEAAWRRWLKERYPDQAALLAAWAEPSFGVGRALQAKPTDVPPEVAAPDPYALPTPAAFAPDGVRGGANPLKVYDYVLFTQSFFDDWVKHERATIREAGSKQLVTVGQDEGGVAGRVSPAFFSPDVSFTTTHAWWDFDSVLWAALSAKMPDEPMLIQEMGEQRRLNQDDQLRLSPQQEAWQLERKFAISFAQGAGGLEWVWNVNARMANDNETPIGAIRPDGTEKPEARVLAGFARFVNRSPQSFTGIEPPAVTIVTSQSLLYTGMWDLAVTAQKKSLRALAYYDHTPAGLLPENRLAQLGKPKLVVLPAPQALTDTAWQQLLGYVAQGGSLLVSGPVQYNEHWQKVDRLAPLHLQATVVPIDVRQSTLTLPGSQHALQITYPAAVQQAPIDTMHFTDGASVEVIRHGAGKLIWAADPVEFSEDYDSTAALYAYALSQASVAPPFRQLQPLSPGVLAFPTMLKDAVLYSFSSESLQDTEVDLEDTATHARLHFLLPSQRAAMILLNRKNGDVLSSYDTNAGR